MMTPLGLVGIPQVNAICLASIKPATGVDKPSGVYSPVLSAVATLVLQPAAVQAVILIWYRVYGSRLETVVVLSEPKL